MTTWRALLALVGLLVAALPARGEELDFAEAPEKDWLGTAWYSVHRGDATVGWMRKSLARGTVESGGGDVPAYVREEEVALRLHGSGGWQRTFHRMTFRAAGEQLLVALRIEQELPGRTYVRTAVRNESRFDVESEFNGRKTTGALVAPRLTLADELSSERLVRDARERKQGAVGASIEALRILNLQKLTARRRTFRIDALRTGEDGAVLGYLLVASQGKDRWTQPFEVDLAGRMTAGDVGSGLRVRRSTEARARDPARISSLEFATRVPMKGKLGDVGTLRRLIVQCRGTAARVFAHGGHQRLQAQKGVLRIEVARDADGVEVTEETRAAALRPTELIDCEHPALSAVVDEVLAGTGVKTHRVQRLLGYTAERIEDGVEHRSLKASELLRDAKGDCTEHTRLFVALCRAAALPAREVHGLVWLGDEEGAFGWHTWAEVELNGRWKPVDPTSNASPADAARIRVREGGPHALALGELRFHLVKVER